MPDDAMTASDAMMPDDAGALRDAADAARPDDAGGAVDAGSDAGLECNDLDPNDSPVPRWVLFAGPRPSETAGGTIAPATYRLDTAEGYGSSSAYNALIRFTADGHFDFGEILGIGFGGRVTVRQRSGTYTIEGTSVVLHATCGAPAEETKPFTFVPGSGETPDELRLHYGGTEIHLYHPLP